MTIIAITGASGFIGSALVKKLKSAENKIIALGRSKIAEADQNIFFSLDSENSSFSLGGIDCLIHCAYDFAPTNFAAIKKINFDGSVRLFEMAKRDGVKNIIFISTTSAFANSISNYGKVKFLIEKYADEISASVVRPGLVFGENCGGIVGALRSFVKKFPFAPLIGKGDQLFYPCHIDDLTSLIEFIVKKPQFNSQNPIVAACAKPIKFRQIIEKFAGAENKKITMIAIPYWVIFSVLKIAEIVGIKIGFRSDSLKYMKRANHQLNFDFGKKNQLNFREF
jgi:nucleoside-diphosphate-sugar epimerase